MKNADLPPLNEGGICRSTTDELLVQDIVHAWNERWDGAPSALASQRVEAMAVLAVRVAKASGWERRPTTPVTPQHQVRTT